MPARAEIHPSRAALSYSSNSSFDSPAVASVEEWRVTTRSRSTSTGRCSAAPLSPGSPPRGAGRDDVWDALDGAPWIDGISETVAALHATGAVVLLATITWRAAADRLAAAHGFDAACGTQPARVCDEEDKATFVVDECQRRGIPLERLAAVGDSRSDLPLFARAGLAIALNADASAREAADVALDTGDLRDVLPLLGVGLPSA